MIQRIQAFFAKQTSLTHWLASAFLFLYAAYYIVPAWAQLVNQGYAVLPPLVKQLVTAAFALWVWYRNGQKPAAPLTPRPPTFVNVVSPKG